MRVKYTLDRVESDLYVFVEKGNEANELIIPFRDININLNEGDIVAITLNKNIYSFELLDETAQRKNDVQNLIEKLKNKK